MCQFLRYCIQQILVGRDYEYLSAFSSGDWHFLRMSAYNLRVRSPSSRTSPRSWSGWRREYISLLYVFAKPFLLNKAYQYQPHLHRHRRHQQSAPNTSLLITPTTMSSDTPSQLLPDTNFLYQTNLSITSTNTSLLFHRHYSPPITSISTVVHPAESTGHKSQMLRTIPLLPGTGIAFSGC